MQMLGEGGTGLPRQGKGKESSFVLLLGHVNSIPAAVPAPQQFLESQHLTHISLAPVGSWSWAPEEGSAFIQAVFAFLCRPGMRAGLALPSLPSPASLGEAPEPQQCQQCPRGSTGAAVGRTARAQQEEFGVSAAFISGKKKMGEKFSVE